MSLSKDDIIKTCEEATESVNKILGGDRYLFVYNDRRQRYEFWEGRCSSPQCIFPLTVGNRPLQEITQWEIYHAVNFVRKQRSNAKL